MNKFIYLTLFFWGLCMTLTAQTNSVTVKGVIIDEESKESLPFATISISKGSKIWGQVSDNEGKFIISLPEKGQYKIKLSYVGKQGEEHEVILKEGVNDLKVLSMKASVQLKDVVVKAAKKLVTMDADKLTYEVSEDPMSKTGSIMDLLPRIPMITIDGQDNIQIKGKTNFKIYMNGKPTALFSNDPSQVLKSIPANTIEKIEVITDPGARYDAEGIDGILNIITTKSKIQGLTGSISLGYGTLKQNNESVHLNAKYGKLGITANVIHSGTNNMDSESLMIQEGGIGDYAFRQVSKAKGVNDFDFTRGFLELSYELDSLNLISLSGHGKLGKYDSNQDIAEEQKVGTSTLAGNRFITQSGDMGTYGINLDFQHSTKKPGELLTLSYQMEGSPDNSKSHNIYRYGNFEEQRKSKSDAKFMEHTGQIDYTTPIGTAHKIEAGLKVIKRTNESDPEYQLFQDNYWVPDNRFRFNGETFKHQYSIYAGYAGYNFTQNKWNFKTGVRVESGNLKVTYSKTQEANFDSKFTDIVPQASLSYSITPAQMLALKYNLRVQRPSISQLNPYENLINDQSISYGNPNLETMKAHIFTLDYNFYSMKFILTNSLSYSFSNNMISDYSYQEEGQPRIISTYGNITKNRALNLNTFAQWNISPSFRWMTNLSVSREHFLSDILNVDKVNYPITIYTSPSLILKNGWMLGAGISYMNGIFNLQTKIDPFYYSSYYVKKSFFNDKLNLSLNITSPLQKNKTFKGEMTGKNFTSYFENSQPSRNFLVSVTYRFGKMKGSIKKIKRGIVNDDVMKDNKNEQQGSGIPMK